MAVNVKIELNDYDENKFPCLMISKDLHQIVLFISDCVGSVVDPGKSSNKIGHYGESWNKPDFRIFTGSITLSNK